MRHCYLFGPVTKEFAEQNLRAHRRAGECIAFNSTGDIDLVIGHTDTWEIVCPRLPTGWQPDFIVLYLPYATIPPCLWSATNPRPEGDCRVPIVGLAANWNLLWHHYRRRLHRCDVVLTDEAGVEIMRREGITQARQAVLYGCGSDFLEKKESRVQPWLLKKPGRDIDVLFVGNLHPAVQRERLPWLVRLARVSERWKVEIHTQVFGDAYRGLLGRARIVFNRSIRGEANRRVFEAVAAGALLFQEEGNLEVPNHLRNRKECVYYNDDNLEELLDYYLDHEDERSTIAEAARARISEFTFESFWEQHLGLIQQELTSVQKEGQNRREKAPGSPPDHGSLSPSPSPFFHHSSPITHHLSLLERTWEAVSSTDKMDPTLATDLAAALAEQPHEASLHNDLGLAITRAEQGLAPLNLPMAERVVGYFQRAVDNDPACVMARLNLVEALVTLDQKQAAVEQARRTLRTIETTIRENGETERVGAPLAASSLLAPGWLDDPHFPPGFDMFRVEWERTAWAHSGRPTGEARAKRNLLRWRLHLILAELTGDLNHYYEAALARPDLSPTRAALGCALARAGSFVEALDHLQCAVAGNPFDWDAVRGLFQAFGAAEDGLGQRRLAGDRRLLARAVPGVVLQEEWFLKVPPVGDELASILILCCNELKYTRQCLESVLRHTRHPYELILIDNGSTDGTREFLEEIRKGRIDRSSLLMGKKAGHPVRVEIIHNDKNLGYAAGNNQGIAKARGRYVIFLNNDTVVTKHWLEGMITWVLHEWPAVGMVGPVSNYASPPQHVANDCTGADGLEAFAARRRTNCAGKAAKTPRLTGFCLLARREVLDHVGGFDDRYGIGFFEDDDLCVRVREAGYQLLVALNIFVHHFGSQTFRSLGIDWQQQLLANFEQFKAKWGPERAAGYQLPTALGSEQWAMSAAAKVAGEQSTWDREETAVSLPSTDHSSLPSVSLCMIVKNEEANLPACLKSAEGLFNEIVVVDTGSTDKTKEVSAQYGARVVDFPWQDSFAAARNESLRHASGDWIFWLDADDRLNEENRKALKRLFMTLKKVRAIGDAAPPRNGDTATPLTQDLGLATSPPAAHHSPVTTAQTSQALPTSHPLIGYSMKCLCLPDPRSRTPTVVDHVRLFPNHPQVRWQYRVHEQILPALRRLGGTVRPAEVTIHHVGYQDPALRKRKQQRDLRLLQLDHADNPDDPFILFNLGWSHSESERPAEALPYLRKSLERSQPADSIVRKLFTLIVQCHRQLSQWPEALESCRIGRQYYPQDSELLFNESLIRRAQGDLPGAETCLLCLMESREDPHFASVQVGLNSFIARHNLAGIYQQQQRFAEAEAQWRFALKEQPSYVPALLGLAGLHLSRQNLGEIENIMGNLETLQPGSVWNLFLRAQTHMARQEYSAARSALDKAISQSPQEVVFWVLLSHALLKEGKDWFAAEQALRKILELDPNNAEARSNLELLLEKLGHAKQPPGDLVLAEGRS
jgi:GT2 family glycosyltransferase